MVKIIRSPEDDKIELSEAEIQSAFEKDLSTLEEGLVFVDHEFERGSGRIDTLAVDEYGKPVFIEYKKRGEFDEGALIQVMDYLGWFLKDESRMQNLVNHIKKKVPTSKVSEDSEIRLILVVSGIGERVRNACYAIQNNIKIFTYNLFRQEDGSDVSLVTKLELDNTNIESGIRAREGPLESEILEKHGNLSTVYNKLNEFTLSLPGVSFHTTGSGQIVFKVKRNFMYLEFQKRQLRVSTKVGADFVNHAIETGKIEGPVGDDAYMNDWLDPDDDIAEDLKEQIKLAADKAK